MPKEIEQRIQRVLSNLLPSTAFEGKYGSPRSLQESMECHNTPGVSIAVINNFEIEWARGFGVCDIRSRESVTNETIFQAGSISKIVFALGVMRLAQEKELSLDEDVNEVLSSWCVPANAGWLPRVTMRQLLSHTAGLTVHGFPGYQAVEELPSVPQILDGVPPSNTARVEVNILPGTQFRYSGGGTTVAQQVLVDLLKKPFPQIMSELVLDPLNLSNSTFAQPLPKNKAGSAATAHSCKSAPLNGRFHCYPEMAAAGLWTTATDLAKVGVELVKVLADRKAPSILTKDSIEAMLTPQLPHQEVGEEEFAGLGFFCNGKDESFRFGHSGRNKGFIADMRLYKSEGKGAVILINSDQGSALVSEVMRSIALEYDWPDSASTQRNVVNLANPGDYAGLYETRAGAQFRLVEAGDDLLLEFGKQPPLPIYPLSEVEFFTPALNMAIKFEKDREGNIIGFIINQRGFKITAGRRTDVEVCSS